MEQSTPRVSVLMSAYNAGSTLGNTIVSILGQTFTDFEFIIIDDGSTDKTAEVIKSFADPRIRLYTNEKNMNLIYSLNRGWEQVRGEYIARMDSDDIALPQRLAEQVEFMDQHPEVGIAGSWIEYFGGAEGIVRFPTGAEEIKAALLYTNVIAQPTVMMRTAMMRQFNLRYEVLKAEDYDLWVRSSFCFPVVNIPEVLLNYRISPKSYSKVNATETNSAVSDMFRGLLKNLGIAADGAEIELHKDIGNSIPLKDKHTLLRAGLHMAAILRGNNSKQIYSRNELRKITLNYWGICCRGLRVSGLSKLYYTWRSGLLMDVLSYRFTK